MCTNQNLYNLFWFQSKHGMTVYLHQPVSSMQETCNKKHKGMKQDSMRSNLFLTLLTQRVYNLCAWHIRDTIRKYGCILIKYSQATLTTAVSQSSMYNSSNVDLPCHIISPDCRSLYVRRKQVSILISARLHLIWIKHKTCIHLMEVACQEQYSVRNWIAMLHEDK